MSRERLIALVVIALLALAGASYLSGRRNGTHDAQGTLLFPTLAAQVNTVSEVTVLKGSPIAVLTVRKRGESWSVAERGDYPADLAKLRRLLLSLTDAKIIEEKTSNPVSYPVIGVEDPLKPDAGSAEVAIDAADGKHAVIVGKSAPDGTFVRRVGEDKSYSVSPAISVDAEPRFWIDTKLLDLNAAEIQKVDVKLADGSSYELHRPAPAVAATPAVSPDAPPASAAPPADFLLTGIPAGRKAADAATLAPSPTTYSNLTLDDVAQAATLDFNKASVATVTMASGNVVTITGTLIGEKHWITLTAPQDAALTAKAKGRAYEISNFRFDAIFRPLEKLLVPKPQPETKKTPPNAKK